MPELPEVETTRLGLEPSVVQRRMLGAKIRVPRLRYALPPRLDAKIKGHRVEALERRGKYLLLRLDNGTIILHLGMSGSLRVVDCDSSPALHDHVDLVFSGGLCLRLRDPRRFGAVLWTSEDPHEHRLLRDLGIEPLTPAFDGDYLFSRSRGRRLAVKSFIMDSHIVVGVGNLYANEALFVAGIDPRRAAGRISRVRYTHLARAIKRVLRDAMAKGGTTLRDFVNGEGAPGYFRLHLRVYGRAGQPCHRCGRRLKSARIGQRSSFFCDRCQR